MKAGRHLPSQPHSCLLGPWTFCPWARCWREEGTEVQRTVGPALLGWDGGSPLSYLLNLVWRREENYHGQQAGQVRSRTGAGSGQEQVQAAVPEIRRRDARTTTRGGSAGTAGPVQAGAGPGDSPVDLAREGQTRTIGTADPTGEQARAGRVQGRAGQGGRPAAPQARQPQAGAGQGRPEQAGQRYGGLGQGKAASRSDPQGARPASRGGCDWRIPRATLREVGTRGDAVVGPGPPLGLPGVVNRA